MEIVVVKIYRGKETYNRSGELTSENSEVKIPYPSKEWGQFLSLAPMMYSNVELVQVLKESIKHDTKEVGGKLVPFQVHSYTPIEASDVIKTSIESLFNRKVELTAEQKQIAELTARLAKLEGGKVDEVKADELTDEKIETPKEGDPKSELTPGQIEVIKDEYTALFGAKPHHKKSIEVLIAEIEAKKNENN